MKLFAFLPLALLSLNAFAMLPPGHYTGRCDVTSSMQEFKNGKKAGKPYVSVGYWLLDRTVTQNGETQTQAAKDKLFMKDGPNGFEYDFTMEAKMISPEIERRTNVKDGGYSDYRLEDDGSLTLISSTDKNGKTRKATGIWNDYVTPEGIVRGVDFDDMGATGNLGKNFSGWALSTSKMWCEQKLDSK
ncbi:MAG: hypothetical protein ACXWQO_02485 [Bdellovibrionota bacterium]